MATGLCKITYRTWKAALLDLLGAQDSPALTGEGGLVYGQDALRPRGGLVWRSLLLAILGAPHVHL